jgi:uncharacterized iron-regulated membrane protein
VSAAAKLPVDPAPLRRAQLYARVWRWHFFAGLFVAPFACLLALTGSVYLFKPQIESALERRVDRDLARGPALPADALLDAALARHPGARFEKLFLAAPDDASAEIQLALADGSRRILWLERTSARVVQEMAPDARAMRVVQKLHGELLGGSYGSAVVELAASWLIVLIASGLYLWWPRRRSWARALFPRLDFATRRWLRDAHGAAGLWLSPVVLLFLLSGLPWTGVWGGAFDRVRWLVRTASVDEHGQHVGAPAAPSASWSRSSADAAPVGAAWSPAAGAPISLQAIVERATEERLAPPVEVVPPGAASDVWTVRSMTQRRPDRVTLEYDAASGAERKRITFADQGALDRAVSYGIALHEGHLFGPLNQLFGVVVALGVIGMSLSGVVMWWQRRPKGSLAIPPLPSDRRLSRGIALAVLGLAAFLPLVAASLIAVALAESFWTYLGSARAGRTPAQST